ncbi:MAG: ATP synthase F1 subunit delta [Calditrichales bacterium]|nr:MAG: ATP synthase F1 subunit delta [Calditrichales bacterium]
MSRVAKRYSKALFALALQEQGVDTVQEDMNMIKAVFSENPDLHNAMINPLIDVKVKSKLLSEVFEERVEPLTFKFLQLLCKKKRSGFLTEMIDYYTERVLEHNGILSGELRSAKVLDADQVSEIRSRIEVLTGKKVRLKILVDNSLVGGFVVKVKDTVVDLSVKTQLEKMRAQLVHG